MFSVLIKLWKDSEFDDYFAIFLPIRLPVPSMKNAATAKIRILKEQVN